MANSVPSATRADAAYETVKARILSLEMAPGSSLTELELAHELGTPWSKSRGSPGSSPAPN